MDFGVQVSAQTRSSRSEDLGLQRGIGVRPAPWLKAGRACRIRDVTQDGHPMAARPAFQGLENVVKFASGAKMAQSRGIEWEARTTPSHQEQPLLNPPRVQGMLLTKGKFRLERTAEDVTQLRAQREQRTPHVVSASPCRKFGADPYNVSTTGANGTSGRNNTWIKQPASWARRQGVRHVAFGW